MNAPQRFVRRAAELADRFGCRYLQTIAPHAEPGAAGRDETIDALGRVADALAPYGVEVGLEYTGFTTIRTLADAVAIVEACGRANVGVCVDVWHHTRSSGAVALAPSVAAPMVRCVQLNDGPLVPVDPDYKTDCLRNRLAPGDGEMDVAGLVDAAHCDGCRRAVDGRGVPRRRGVDRRTRPNPRAALHRRRPRRSRAVAQDSPRTT